MKVYVDELPKSCEGCEFRDKNYPVCKINGARVEFFGCHSLTQLSDYTKQVRKKVCEEIRSKLDDISGEHEIKVKGGIGKFTCVPRHTLEELLDQIQ